MMKIMLYVLLIGVMIVLMPFAAIWSLNTLFPVLAIPYTLETWSAIILIGMFLKGNVTVRK